LDELKMNMRTRDEEKRREELILAREKMNDMPTD
jgi:hypothetical protein